jgi:hypothetical protein
MEKSDLKVREARKRLPTKDERWGVGHCNDLLFWLLDDTFHSDPSKQTRCFQYLFTKDGIATRRSSAASGHSPKPSAKDAEMKFERR